MPVRRELSPVAVLMFLAGSLGTLGSAAAIEEFSEADQKALTGIVEKGMADQRQPGLNVGIWIPGRGTWVRSFGKADLETGAPMEIADHVRIASITKTFVAMATLRLVDAGKLSLDDRLSSYVDGIANGDRITIRNLLGMTSGIYDFTSDKQFLKDFTDNPQMPFGPDDAIAIVRRHEPDFAPGEKVVYCDTNYVLLGVIIAKASGKPVERVIKEEVLGPLKLNDTSYPTTAAMPEPFARGYYAGDDGKGPFEDYSESNPAVAGGAGAMISTLDDLRVWAKVLATGSLLSPALRAERLAFQPLTGVKGVGYGLGVANFYGFIGHNGAIFGYTTAVFYLPAADATFVIEGNQSSNFSTATTEIFFGLAKFLYPDLFK